MIPYFNASMVLPPFTGDDPGVSASMAPYKASILEVVSRFATSIERIALLNALLLYRKALIKIGIVDGFQWLAGSFVEDVEESRKRPPADIDLVTFSRRPVFANKESFQQWILSNMSLLDPEQAKTVFMCDAYFVDLLKPPELLVDDTRYWFGLFSHQRETALWKGMLQVPLCSDDDAAKAFLDTIKFDSKEVDYA